MKARILVTLWCLVVLGKAPVRDGKQVEHFWLDEVRQRPRRFHGKLGNDPEIVRSHKYGEPVDVPRTGDFRLDVRRW